MRLGIATLVVMASMAPVAAQTVNQDAQLCATTTGAPAQIAACDALIAYDEQKDAAHLTSDLIDRGNSYYAIGNYPKAIESYDMAIDADPADNAAFFDRGLAWTQRKQYGLALADYSHAMALTGDPGARKAIQNYEVGAFDLPADKSYADEETDFGIPPQSDLFADADLAKPTPTSITGVTNLTTRQVAAKMKSDDRFVLVQAIEDNAKLPGAVMAGFASGGGTFADQTQKSLGRFMLDYTNGDLDRALIVYCGSAQCRHAYNALLRLKALGYRNLFWYRGGMDSWAEARLPETIP